MHEKKLYGTATVGTKGQIVIPADAREELGIKPGDRLYAVGSPKSGVIGFIQEEQMESFIERLTINMQELKKFRTHDKKD